MDQAEASALLNTSPILPATSLKRKHQEIANSESEDEEAEAEADSDLEFGWAGLQDPPNAESLPD